MKTWNNLHKHGICMGHMMMCFRFRFGSRFCHNRGYCMGNQVGEEMDHWSFSVFCLRFLERVDGFYESQLVLNLEVFDLVHSLHKDEYHKEDKTMTCLRFNALRSIIRISICCWNQTFHHQSFFFASEQVCVRHDHHQLYE